MPRITTWSGCWGEFPVPSARGEPGNSYIRRLEPGASAARAAKMAAPLPRGPKWWSRATKKGLPTSSCGAKCLGNGKTVEGTKSPAARDSSGTKFLGTKFLATRFLATRFLGTRFLQSGFSHCICNRRRYVRAFDGSHDLDFRRAGSDGHPVPDERNGQAISQSGATRGTHRVRPGRNAGGAGARHAGVSHGAGLPRSVARTHVVRCSAAAGSLHQTRGCGDRGSRGADQSEI